MEAIPQVLANCKIVGRIGQGGMGTVFRAVHLTLGRAVAIKILPAEFTRNPEYISRFIREARTIASLSHPNIVLVHDAGEQAGFYYIAMELVDGASLGAVTRHCGALPEGVALDFLAQATRGLGYAHRHGLVHRDIKPENLLVNREGVMKVVDFGLVLESASQSHLTRTGAFLGTPTFMSPEQCDGEVADARSDLYSLGATFYCVVSGRAPFVATSTLGLMFKHKFEPPPPLEPHVSEATRKILFRLLEKPREARYQNAAQLLEDILQAQRALPPDSRVSLEEEAEPGSEGQAVPVSALDETKRDMSAHRPKWSLKNVLLTVSPPVPDVGVADTEFSPRAPTPVPATAGPRPTPAAGYPYPTGAVAAGTPAAGYDPTLVQGSPVPGARLAVPSDLAPTMPPQAGVAQYPGTPNAVYLPTPAGLAPPGTLLPPPLTPGLGPMPGISTPGLGQGAPGAAVRRRGWLVPVAILLLLVVVGGGGYYGYVLNRQRQLAQYVEDIRRLAAEGDLDAATQRLYLGLASFPDDQKLYSLRAELRMRQEEAEKSRQKTVIQQYQFENLLVRAKTAADAKDYEKAISLYEQAGKQGLEASKVAAKTREVRFEQLNAQSQTAESGGRWAEALDLARKALEFGAGEERVQRLELRLKVEDLRTQAQKAVSQKELLAAAGKLEEAAGYSNAKADPALKEQLLASARDYRRQHYLQLAEAAEKNRQWNPAVTALSELLKLEPNNKDFLQRMEAARASLAGETDYESSMASGQKDLQAGKWTEALEMFRTALKHKPDSTLAQSRMAEADAHVKLDAALGLMEKRDWPKAQTALQEVLDGIRTVDLAPLKTEIQQHLATVQGQLGQITQKETAARAAAQAGRWDEAIADYEALSTTNPAGREGYQGILSGLKANQAYAERLKEGDAFLKTGAFASARAAYGRALEKKNDKTAQAEVAQKVARVDEAEKAIQDAEKLRQDTEKTRQDAEKLRQENAARQARYQNCMDEARQKQGQQDWAGARAALEKALEATPNDLTATTMLRAVELASRPQPKSSSLDELRGRLGQFVQAGQLNDAVTALNAAVAQGSQEPETSQLNELSATLNVLAEAVRASDAAEQTLAQGIVALDQGPTGSVNSLKQDLLRARGELPGVRAESQRLFVARDYPASQKAAREAATTVKSNARGALESAAGDLDRLAAQEASTGGGKGPSYSHEVGEVSVDTPPPASRGDPAKAAKYRQVASSLRTLSGRL